MYPHPYIHPSHSGGAGKRMNINAESRERERMLLRGDMYGVAKVDAGFDHEGPRLGTIIPNLKL